MRGKRVLMFVFLMALFTVALIGDDRPEVLQPTPTNFSEAELSVLTSAMNDLSSILSDGYWASRRTFSGQVWQSADFAVYTAGILAGLGYQVRIVSEDGWPDGVHAWVLVGIPLADRTVWIPVEAAPPPGGSQELLGRIPGYGDDGRESRFDEAYIDFDTVITSPANLPPVASIRVPMLAFATGEQIRFSPLGTYDPDGEIVRCHWDFGDGATPVSDREGAFHAFTEPGVYLVTLAVIDDHGAHAVARLTVHVVEAIDPEELPQPPAGGGCGCG
jgi:hypothetical protein